MRLASLLVGTCFMPAALAADPLPEKDLHSFSNPEHVRVKSLYLQLDVNFETRVLTGDAMLTIERVSADKTRPLVLDVRGLKIESVSEDDGNNSTAVKYELGTVDPILGQPLTIPIKANTTMVIVNYKTGP